MLTVPRTRFLNLVSTLKSATISVAGKITIRSQVDIHLGIGLPALVTDIVFQHVAVDTTHSLGFTVGLQETNITDTKRRIINFFIFIFF
mgnify:CR=1 FL=1